jgi:hypothetical protein
MSNPYDPPPDKPKAKQRWLTAQFVVEFAVGCVIGFFVLCFATMILLWSMTV